MAQETKSIASAQPHPSSAGSEREWTFTVFGHNPKYSNRNLEIQAYSCYGNACCKVCLTPSTFHKVQPKNFSPNHCTFSGYSKYSTLLLA